MSILYLWLDFFRGKKIIFYFISFNSRSTLYLWVITSRSIPEIFDMSKCSNDIVLWGSWEVFSLSPQRVGCWFELFVYVLSHLRLLPLLLPQISSSISTAKISGLYLSWLSQNKNIHKLDAPNFLNFSTNWKFDHLMLEERTTFISSNDQFFYNVDKFHLIKWSNWKMRSSTYHIVHRVHVYNHHFLVDH